jgi:hypothetical protein
MPAILDAQYPEGYWVKPGGGYSPSYRATIWQVMFLAELGADPSDARLRRGCEYVLGHSAAANGGFSMGHRSVPSSVVHCLNGDLLHALLRFGYAHDPRVQAAVEWQAQAITGTGQIHYYRSGTSGPDFACGYNQRQPCAWGAVKALKALSALPKAHQTASTQLALDAAAQFLLSRDPAVADYPFTGSVHASWFEFGFPLNYRSDVLETTAALVDVGCRRDPRLKNALRFIQRKQNSQGRWIMEKSLNGKMWADVETKGQPSKWVTLRALRTLQRAGLDEGP